MTEPYMPLNYVAWYAYDIDGIQRDPEAEKALIDLLADLRRRGLLRAELESGVSAAVLVDRIIWAAAEYKHLAEAVGQGGRETKAVASAQLAELSRAMKQLDEAASVIQEIMGGNLAEGLSHLGRRAIMNAGQEAGRGDIFYCPPEAPDVTLPDPLGWMEMSRLFVLARARHWVEQRQGLVDAGAVLLRTPGKDKGRPELTFARRALATWLIADRSESEPVRLPARKHFEEWLTAAATVGGVTIQKSSVAGEALNELSNLIRQGKAQQPPLPVL